MNELIFILHALFIGSAALAALYFGAAALTAFVVVQCLLANLFVIKQTTLFGLTATCADAYAIGATIGLNLLQEYYGKGATRATVLINFFLLIFYGIATQFQLWYCPNSIDAMHPHFAQILYCAPRIILASFTTFLLVQFLDYKLYGFLIERFQSRYLLLRNYASVFICQFIDTVLFSFLGLYGILDNIGEIIVISYSVKVMAILLATPLVMFSKIVYRLRLRNKCIGNA